MSNSAFRGNITAQKFEPQGRLTLATGTPVMATEQAAKTTIYYTPYKGDMIPVNSGGQFAAKQFSELSLALDSDSGHTGYHQSGKNFDLFVVNDSGTLRLVSGPAWTDDTTRATALEYEQGLLVNNGSMTARFGSASGNTLTIADEEGTYVGTFRASANGTTTWELGGAAAGGDEGRLFLWNCYNRVRAGCYVKDSTDSWSYNSATIRATNSSALMRVSFVRGLNENPVEAFAHTLATASSAPCSLFAGIGLDSTTAYSGIPGFNTVDVANFATGVEGAHYRDLPGIGLHYLQQLEASLSAVTTTTWYGDAGGPLNYQTGMSVMGMF